MRRNQNSALLEPIPNFKYHLSKIKRKTEDEEDCYLGSGLNKERIRTSMGSYHPSRVYCQDSFARADEIEEKPLYGEGNVNNKRSCTNHRNRNRENNICMKSRKHLGTNINPESLDSNNMIINLNPVTGKSARYDNFNMFNENSKTMKSRENPMSVDSNLLYLKGIQKVCAEELPPIHSDDTFTSKLQQISTERQKVKQDSEIMKSLEREKSK